MHESAEEQTLAEILGSTLFTLAAILLLSLLARRGQGSAEMRVGTAYALAGAWSILLLVKNPVGEHGLLDFVKGEIISISGFELWVTAGTFALIIAALFVFQKEFLALFLFHRGYGRDAQRKMWSAGTCSCFF